MNSIFSFFARSCGDPSFTAQTFWEDLIKEKGGPARARSNSDTVQSSHEVLVTTLPVSSNWVPDAMVGLARMVHCRLMSVRSVSFPSPSLFVSIIVVLVDVLFVPCVPNTRWYSKVMKLLIEYAVLVTLTTRKKVLIVSFLKSSAFCLLEFNSSSH